MLKKYNRDGINSSHSRSVSRSVQRSRSPSRPVQRSRSVSRSVSRQRSVSRSVQRSRSVSPPRDIWRRSQVKQYRARRHSISSVSYSSSKRQMQRSNARHYLNDPRSVSEQKSRGGYQRRSQFERNQQQYRPLTGNNAQKQNIKQAQSRVIEEYTGQKNKNQIHSNMVQNNKSNAKNTQNASNKQLIIKPAQKKQQPILLRKSIKDQPAINTNQSKAKNSQVKQNRWRIPQDEDDVEVIIDSEQSYKEDQKKPKKKAAKKESKRSHKKGAKKQSKPKPKPKSKAKAKTVQSIAKPEEQEALLPKITFIFNDGLPQQNIKDIYRAFARLVSQNIQPESINRFLYDYLMRLNHWKTEIFFVIEQQPQHHLDSSQDFNYSLWEFNRLHYSFIIVNRAALNNEDYDIAPSPIRKIAYK